MKAGAARKAACFFFVSSQLSVVSWNDAKLAATFLVIVGSSTQSEVAT
jgi:hypothetical protein